MDNRVSRYESSLWMAHVAFSSKRKTNFRFVVVVFHILLGGAHHQTHTHKKIKATNDEAGNDFVL